MTNADVIRQMSDEDLRDFLTTWKNDGYELDYPVTHCELCKDFGNALGLDCDGCLLHWLKKDSRDYDGLYSSFKIKPIKAIPIEWLKKEFEKIETKMTNVDDYWSWSKIEETIWFDLNKWRKEFEWKRYL